jgi:hypothetical protein
VKVITSILFELSPNLPISGGAKRRPRAKASVTKRVEILVAASRAAHHVHRCPWVDKRRLGAVVDLTRRESEKNVVTE